MTMEKSKVVKPFPVPYVGMVFYGEHGTIYEVTKITDINIYFGGTFCEIYYWNSLFERKKLLLTKPTK